MEKKKHFETQAIRTQTERSQKQEHCSPIYETSSYIFNNAEEARAAFAEEIDNHIYTRYSNPNTDEFIDKLCLLEGVDDGISTASGMSAIFLALVSLLRAGDHIVSSRNIFGSTHLMLSNVLSRWGISHTYVDIDDNEAWEEAIMPQTKLLFVETPSNPALDIADLEFIGKLAKDNNCLYVVDNSFATPYLQNPAKYGAQLICHSSTKFIDGQGRTISGAVLGSKDIISEVRTLARQIGPTLSPFDAWILSKSMETLAIRMDRHCENALKLAEYLESLKDVMTIRYPFLKSHDQEALARKQMSQGGGMVSFELKGGPERCLNFLDQLEMLSLTPNLGDTRTTITHPATTTHSKLTIEERESVNITDSLVRVSVGLEHIEDIIGDIEQAIGKS